MRNRSWKIGMVVGWMSLVLVAWSTHAFAEMAKWNVDSDHSTIGFQVSHMVISKTNGKFTDYRGVIEMDPEAKKVSKIEAVIQTSSVFTDHEKRDGHLRSPDFFDVEKHPTMTYTMKSYEKSGDTYTAIGDLTMHGVTKEVTLVGSFNGVVQDPWGNTRAGFAGEGTINRQDFGMKFSKTLDNGGLLVGDEVKIKLEIECIKEKSAANERVKRSSRQ